MKPETVNQIIRWYGGKKWLENIELATLFILLKDKDLKTVDVRNIVLNNNEGWILSIEDVRPEIVRVIGYFYQKGEWPVCYSGELKEDQRGFGLVLVVTLSMIHDPKIGDFRFIFSKLWNLPVRLKIKRERAGGLE